MFMGPRSHEYGIARRAVTVFAKLDVVLLNLILDYMWVTIGFFVGLATMLGTPSAEWVPRDDMGSDTKEGSKVQRALGHLQGMACHSRG
jgi:hypothetical protein